MQHNILSHKIVIQGLLDKSLEVSNDELKNHILSIQNPQKIKDYHYKYTDHTKIFNLQQYFRENIGAYYKLSLVEKDFNFVSLNSNEETSFMYDIDLTDLPNSIDYHMIYCLNAEDVKTNLILQYDDGRYLNKEYAVLLKPRHFIFFSSDIRYKIINTTKNKSLFFHFTYHNYSKNILMDGNLK